MLRGPYDGQIQDTPYLLLKTCAQILLGLPRDIQIKIRLVLKSTLYELCFTDTPSPSDNGKTRIDTGFLTNLPQQCDLSLSIVEPHAIKCPFILPRFNFGRSYHFAFP